MCTGTRGCCKQVSWCALQRADPASLLLGQPEGVTLRLVDCGDVPYWSDGNSLRHHFPSGMSAKDTIVANSNRGTSAEEKIVGEGPRSSRTAAFRNRSPPFARKRQNGYFFFFFLLVVSSLSLLSFTRLRA